MEDDRTFYHSEMYMLDCEWTVCIMQWNLSIADVLWTTDYVLIRGDIIVFEGIITTCIMFAYLGNTYLRLCIVS